MLRVTICSGGAGGSSDCEKRYRSRRSERLNRTALEPSLPHCHPRAIAPTLPPAFNTTTAKLEGSLRKLQMKHEEEETAKARALKRIDMVLLMRAVASAYRRLNVPGAAAAAATTAAAADRESSPSTPESAGSDDDDKHLPTEEILGKLRGRWAVVVAHASAGEDGDSTAAAGKSDGRRNGKPSSQVAANGNGNGIASGSTTTSDVSGSSGGDYELGGADGSSGGGSGGMSDYASTRAAVGDCLDPEVVLARYVEGARFVQTWWGGWGKVGLPAEI